MGREGPTSQKGVQAMPGLQGQDTEWPGKWPAPELVCHQRIKETSDTVRMEDVKGHLGSQFRTESIPARQTGSGHYHPGRNVYKLGGSLGKRGQVGERRVSEPSKDKQARMSRSTVGSRKAHWLPRAWLVAFLEGRREEGASPLAPGP